MGKRVKAFGVLIFLIILTSIGVAIMIKTGLGLGPWDATALTFSYITGIKVGTMGMIFNFICIVGQIIILKSNFKGIKLLQIPIAMLLGHVINFVHYVVFKDLVINNYIVALISYILALICMSGIIGGIVELNLTTFPVEGLCLAISEKFNISFAKIRQLLDVVCIFLIVVLTLIFSVKWSMREATIMSMVIFAPVMGKFMPLIRKIYKKYGII